MRAPGRTSLVTVDLQISAGGTGVDLPQVGGAVRCIRGVASARPGADGRHITVSYEPGKVHPLQFERAVRVMGAVLDRIELRAGPAPAANAAETEESAC